MSEPSFAPGSIRCAWHKDAWWYSIVDVVAVVSGSLQPEAYLKHVRKQDRDLISGWSQIAVRLRIRGANGVQQVNCTNIDGALRIIQSIRSPRAEQLKRWLAKTGGERIRELSDKLPEPMTELELLLATADESGTIHPQPPMYRGFVAQPLAAYHVDGRLH